MRPAQRQPARRTVIDGCDRDFRTPGEENWVHRIIVDNKQRWAMALPGRGVLPDHPLPVPLPVRQRVGPRPGAQGRADRAHAGRAGLPEPEGAAAHRRPVTSYEEDGVMNVEAGLDAGTWMPRAAGSKPPETLTPEVRFDALVWNVDQLKDGIKKALYQDRPEQDGKTPPTLGQWNDEKVWNSRRRELPRDRSSASG
jgi:hypothetical protein